MNILKELTPAGSLPTPSFSFVSLFHNYENHILLVEIVPLKEYNIICNSVLVYAEVLNGTTYDHSDG